MRSISTTRPLYLLVLLFALVTLAACGGGYGGAAALYSGAPMRPTTTHDASSSERYTDYGQNPTVDTTVDNLSTFAIDVDTASYTISRRKLTEGALPPQSAVRVEEFVNFFRYGYTAPDGGQPFAVHVDGAPSPFVDGEVLLRVGLQGKVVEDAQRKPVNLTFLVDVSGSMGSADKLGLAKIALRTLVDQLDQRDTISLVTYAGNTRVVLEATPANERGRIHAAIEDLTAGGSTAMSSGLQLAYEQASVHAGPGVESRVIVISDGDANVGSTDHGSMLDSIAHYVDELGITMSTIGVGMGNYQDTTMEQLADQGNGNYFYVDGHAEVQRVFVEQLGGTLEVIARDVKVQVEFDPATVARYRLIGYENRDVADEDFRNDAVDGGEIGAGHTVTALYALELTDNPSPTLGNVRVRYKGAEAVLADEAGETVRDMPLEIIAATFPTASPDLRFAVAVASFAERLRGNPTAAAWSMDTIGEIARESAGADEERAELVALIEHSRELGL